MLLLPSRGVQIPSPPGVWARGLARGVPAWDSLGLLDPLLLHAHVPMLPSLLLCVVSCSSVRDFVPFTPQALGRDYA